MANKRTLNLGLLAVSVLVALLIFEGIARLLPQSLFTYRSVFKGDPVFGIPIFNADPTKDFPEGTKPRDVFRIVVVGDSHTAPTNVKNPSTYAEVLEGLLNREDVGGKRVEVYNAGGPGHSHYQYYLALKSLGRYQPDLAIVGFYIGNDFLDLYRNDDRPSLSFDGTKFVHNDPEFSKYYDPNTSALVRSSRAVQLLQLALQQTVGYQLSRVKVLWAVGKQSGEGNVAAAKYLFTITRGYFINQHIFRQSMNQILFLRTFPREKGVIDRVDQRVTELMKELSLSTGMKLLYVPIPTKLQVEPDSDWPAIEKTLQLCGYDRSALRMEDELSRSFFALLEEHALDYVRVEGRLEEAARSGVLYDDTYHLKERGHAIVAEALREKVLQLVAASREGSLKH